MAMSSEAVDATIIVMWVLVAITMTFVVLRLYTRMFIIRSVGADDIAYTLSGLLLILFTGFVQVARRYGYGENALILELPDVALAIFWEMVGQTFAVVGMSVAKISLGLFLLRFVVEMWHQIAIWTVMVTLFAWSCVTAIMFWVQCRPVQGIYDPRVKPTAICDINITPFATTLGVLCIIADFFFAIFPAIVIWPLNMKRREKITLITSLGLGVLAGIAGIIRTYEVATGFSGANYTQDTVGLIIWSAVEVCVTMVCIGIPILRPLYNTIVKGYVSSNDKSYQKQSEQSTGAYELSARERGEGSRGLNSKLGMYTQTVTDIQTANTSDEHILPPHSAHHTSADNSQSRHIYVTDNVKVEWGRGK